MIVDFEKGKYYRFDFEAYKAASSSLIDRSLYSTIDYKGTPIPSFWSKRMAKVFMGGKIAKCKHTPNVYGRNPYAKAMFEGYDKVVEWGSNSMAMWAGPNQPNNTSQIFKYFHEVDKLQLLLLSRRKKTKKTRDEKLINKIDKILSAR